MSKNTKSFDTFLLPIILPPVFISIFLNISDFRSSYSYLSLIYLIVSDIAKYGYIGRNYFANTLFKAINFNIIINVYY
jgi:hypothetical protein